MEAKSDIRIQGIFLAEDDMDIESKRGDVTIQDDLYAGDDIDVDARRGDTNVAGQLFKDVADDLLISISPSLFTSEGLLSAAGYGGEAGVATMASIDDFEDEFALLAKPRLLQDSDMEDSGSGGAST